MKHGWRRLWAGGLGLAAGCVLMAGLTAQAANYYYVSRDGSHDSPFEDWSRAATNIQAAIDRAESDLALAPGTACIVVVTNDTYTLSTQIVISAAITMRSFTGWEETIIDGGGVTRCVKISAAAVLDGFTISNGYDNVTDQYQGAGVHVTGNGTVRNCLITCNRLPVSTSTSNLGAGVFASGATVSNCVITLNSGTGSSGARGGGVYAAGANTYILDSVISGNSLRAGAGIALASTTAIARRCEISYNKQSGSGSGGGVYLMYGMIENCLVIGNESDGAGGGVSGVRSSDVVRNCTIVGNKSALGNTANNSAGGVYLSPSYQGTIVNSIVYGNQAAGVASDVAGHTNKVTYSCASDILGGAGGRITDDPQFASWSAANGYGNAHVRGDYKLKIVSPCIDTGTAAGAPNHDRDNHPRPTDGNGDTVADYDMGCYEAPDAASQPLSCDFTSIPPEGAAPLEVVFTASSGGSTNGIGYQWIFGDGTSNNWSGARTVTNSYTTAGTFEVVLNVTNASAETASATNTVSVYPLIVYVVTNGLHQPPFDTWEKAATNIQDAVDAAAEGYSSVRVGSGIYVLTNTLVIDKAIAVSSANGRDVTVIDGGFPAYTNRCVTMTAILGATLEGFTIRNGLATDSGGGVYCEYGTVRDCLIVSNSAQSVGGSGVHLGPSGRILDSTVADNASSGTGFTPYGGGILFAGVASYPCVVSNCIVAGNTSRNNGGGIFGSYGTVRDCRIEGNRVTYTGSAATGGGAYVTTGVLMENCTILSNYCGTDGGGVDLRHTAVMRNCLVAGNEGRNGGGVSLFSNTGSKQRIESCTIVGNYARTASGGVHGALAASTATNMIVYFNQAAGAGQDIGGTHTNFAFSCSPGLANGINGNLSADPMFADGGSGFGLGHTLGGDHRLRIGSPCIDTGANQPWMSGALDLYGMPRLQPAGGVVNMGAVEGIWRPPGTLFMVR